MNNTYNQVAADGRPPPYDKVTRRDRVGVVVINVLTRLFLSRGYRDRLEFFTMRGIEAQNYLERTPESQ